MAPLSWRPTVTMAGTASVALHEHAAGYGPVTILSDGMNGSTAAVSLADFILQPFNVGEEIAALGEYPQWVRAFDRNPAVGQQTC